MSAQSWVTSRCDVAHCDREELHYFLPVLLRGVLPLFSIMTLWSCLHISLSWNHSIGINLMYLKPSYVDLFTFYDTTLFSKGNNLDDLIDLTNNELVKIDKWVCANKLSHNINKTAFSICSTKAVTDVRRVKIRNVEINLVNNFKLLRIIIDSNLSFSNHYQNICNKTSRSSSVVSKLACYVPQPILRKLYQTMISPHLNYGIEIWGNCCTTGIKRLQRIQNKCIKIISSTNTCEPSDFA